MATLIRNLRHDFGDRNVGPRLRARLEPAVLDFKLNPLEQMAARRKRPLWRRLLDWLRG